jgi:hypothetical protein
MRENVGPSAISGVVRSQFQGDLVSPYSPNATRILHFLSYAIGFLTHR